MLHWQRRALPKKYFFLGKLLFISCMGHLLTLGFVLYMHKQDAIAHIDLSRISATVMYVPFYKTIAGARELVQVQNVQGDGQLQVIRAGTSQLPDAVNQGAQLPGISTTSARSTTKMVTIKEAKNTKKQKRKKKQRKKTKKLPQQKTQKKEKKIEQEPAPTKQQPITSSSPEQKSASSAIAESQSQPIDLSQVVADGPVIFAGQYDMDILELNNDIHAEIEHVWHPPVGLSSGKCCKVRVVVTSEGTVETLELIEPSDVLAFDMSVRHAVMAMKFPRAAYGKELIIPFT